MNLKMLCEKGFKSFKKFIRGVHKFEYNITDNNFILCISSSFKILKFV